MSTSWKKAPMKITASFCASPMPAHRIRSGTTRKVFETKPPSVAMAHTATNTMKNSTPSPSRGPGATGCSGFKTASLDVARVGEALHLGHLLDDADLEQEVGRFLAELRML